jgi:hypothetical protein
MTINEFADILSAAGHAHHQAYLTTNGDDPEWPLWYANHLKDKLNARFDHHFTQSELVYLLVKLDNDYQAQKPDILWPQYYARHLIEWFGQ